MLRNDLWWSRDLAGAYFNGVEYGMGSHCPKQVWASSQGPTEERTLGQLQGILNRQVALVPSSPSFVVLLGSVGQFKVASDSPWDTRGHDEGRRSSPGQGA